MGKLSIELPVVPLPNSPYSIIVFDSFGKTSLIQDIAQQALQTFLKPDVIVCPEAKAIPLTQEMARLWNIDYFVLRKAKKLYMKEPKNIIVRSITTDAEQELWYDVADTHFMKDKKIMLFDDVISSGSTLQALLTFAKENVLSISSIATIFLEGDSLNTEELIETYGRLDYLGHLPLLTT